MRRISARDLQSFANTPEALPPPVEPRLTLAEEVVLLSLGARRSRVNEAVRVAARAYPREPQSHHEAVRSLERRGMLGRTGKLRALAATPAARIGERDARVFALIRRPAAPVQADAELLVLLAASRATHFAHPQDHLRARMRIGSIGTNDELPAAVAMLCTDLRVGSMAELADILLPAQRDFRNANFDPGSGTWLGGM